MLDGVAGDVLCNTCVPAAVIRPGWLAAGNNIGVPSGGMPSRHFPLHNIDTTRVPQGQCPARPLCLKLCRPLLVSNNQTSRACISSTTYHAALQSHGLCPGARWTQWCCQSAEPRCKPNLW